MTKNELVADVAKEQGVRKEVAMRVVNAFIEHIKLAMRMRGEVVIRNFGTFKVRHYNSHKVVSIKTGKPMMTPATDKVVFEMSRGYGYNWLGEWR